MKYLFKLPFFLVFLSGCVASLQVENVSMPLGKIIPNINSTADQIDISWYTGGASIGVNYGGHYFEGKYMIAQTSSDIGVDKFSYKDSSSGTSIIQEVSSINVKVMGLYYTPFFGHGFLMGAGLERWSLGFKSSDSQVHVYTPLLDIGYQIGDKIGNNWWGWLMGGGGKPFWTVMARTTTAQKPIYQLKLNYEF